MAAKTQVYSALVRPQISAIFRARRTPWPAQAAAKFPFHVPPQLLGSPPSTCRLSQTQSWSCAVTRFPASSPVLFPNGSLASPFAVAYPLPPPTGHLRLARYIARFASRRAASPPPLEYFFVAFLLPRRPVAGTERRPLPNEPRIPRLATSSASREQGARIRRYGHPSRRFSWILCMAS